MKLGKIVPIVAAGAVAGILGVGGASLALAQEEPSTTTPSTPSTGDDQQPSTTAPDGGQRPDGNCPDHDGSQRDDSSTEGSSLLIAN